MWMLVVLRVRELGLWSELVVRVSVSVSFSDGLMDADGRNFLLL